MSSDVKVRNNKILFLLFAFIAFMGSFFYGIANSTAHVAIVIILFFSLGAATVSLLFRGKKPEFRGYFYTFCICVFFGGLAQSYSNLAFDNLQSTYDAANFFYPNIDLIPPFQKPEKQLFSMEYALPIVIWQQLYVFFWNVGIDSGPYIGVILNSVTMAIAASITVNTARLVYGNDIVKLNRVAILFSLCGIFILFGTILLRDCFITLLNIIVLWGTIKWLKAPKAFNTIILLFVLVVCSIFMFFLRVEAIALLGAHSLLAIFFWFFKRGLTPFRLIILGLGGVLIVVLSGTVIEYINLMIEIQDSGLTQYGGFSTDESSNNSLGMQIVINQPFPIRLVTGTAVMLLYPLPLWVHFNFESNDYNWLLGFYGIFKVVLIPSVIVSIYLILQSYNKKRDAYTVLVYISLYLIVNVAAVVMTSLEPRHLGQFMAAFIILSVFPDQNCKSHKRKLSSVSLIWYSGVFFIHLAWIVIKVF